MAVQKLSNKRVVVMENKYKETSLHRIYEAKQWLLKWCSIWYLLVLVFHHYYSFDSFFFTAVPTFSSIVFFYDTTVSHISG